MKTASVARLGHRASHLLAIFVLASVAQGAFARPVSAEEDSWSPRAPLPTPRRLLAAAVEKGVIYTFGGCGSPCFDPPLHTSTFEETRLEVFENGAWSVRRPIPAILFGAAAAAPGDGKIYVFGGFVTGGEAYEYTPQTDTWSRKAPMPTPRHGLAAVALNGKVYVLGGSNGSAATGALEVYDPALNSWRRLAPMPTPRVFLAAAAVNGKIYAIGGSPDCCGNSRTDVVEVYNPGSDSWRRAAPLPVALQVSAAAEVNGKIYVLGGFIPGSGVQGSTFEYDPVMDRWTSRSPMPEPRDQAPAVVLRGVVHVLGGSVDCHCHARATHDGYTPPPPPPPLTADLEIKKKSVPPGPVCPGETVHYTIRVTNLGPAAVSGATVTDDLEATGLQGIRWCRKPDCKPSHAGNLLDTVSLAANESVIYEAVGTVALTATGTIANTAEVHPPLSPGDSDSHNNSSMATNPIVPCSVSITKTANRSTAAPGDELVYQIAIRNLRSAPVQATVTDELAATGLTAIRWCRGAVCGAGNLAETVELPANGTVAYEVTGTVPCLCGKTRIDNRACVTVPGQPEVCDSSTVPILPAPGGDLELAVTGPGDLTDCGALPYTFTVTNRGPGIACGAVLQVQPPAGSAIVAISSPCAGLPCGLGDIGPGSRIEVTGTFSVPAGLRCPTAFSTTASVSACGGGAESAFETKVPCVLAVTKSDGRDTASPGDSILYAIGVKNQGCAAVSGAEVADAFPAGLENVLWCRGTDCTPPSLPAPLVPLMDTLDLPAGGTETYRAAGTVAPMFSGTLRNTVTVSPPGGAPVSATDETRVVPTPGLTAFCKRISGSPFEGGTITKIFVISNGGPAIQGDNPGPEFVDVLPPGLTLVGATASSGTVTTAANTVSWNGAIPVGGMVTVQIMASVDAGTLGMTICNGATTHFDADGDGVNESSRPTPAPCCFRVLQLPLIPSLSGPGLAVLALLLAALAFIRLRRRGA
jgi:uncharacterized repeat protein (TIGR01451 family)